MTDTPPAFTPDPPDPRLEALDDEIADLIAEALFEHLLKHGLVPPVCRPQDEGEDKAS
ncbi:MAG: hypothetical protein HYW10_04190 [Candidatus Omnitrophica bacterium]|nr:hypothetical protein [Candidatus Omnitrophota bacterium]